MSVSALLNGILDINVKKLNTNEIKSIDNLKITAQRIILSSNDGIGKTRLLTGDTEVKVDVKGMNNDAIILLTPRDNIVNFWVEPDDEFFTIHTDTAPHTDVRFFYFVLSYE
jgi:accessory colonization factor AcfC